MSQVREVALDPAECYRIFDLNFSEGDLRVYFTSGYLIFAKPVEGVVTGAIFTAKVEAGDGEVLLLPPIRSERLSLVRFTGSPNLDEHISSAALLFTGRTGPDLKTQIQASGAKKSPEMGALLAEKYAATMRNLAESFEIPLATHLLNREYVAGFFYMAVSGTKLGNFDLFWNPEDREDMLAGQSVENGDREYYNVWTSFPSREARRRVSGQEPREKLGNFRIDATIAPDLTLQTVTRVSYTPQQAAGRALAFEISQKMHVTFAAIDGHGAEVLERDTPHSPFLEAGQNQIFLLVSPFEPAAGESHEIEIRTEGAVIGQAGNRVFSVGARGNWYPRRGTDVAGYDLTFRYPKEFRLVSTGEPVEERVEGATRITHRKTSAPVRFAAFNLGDYESVKIQHPPYQIEVYGNRGIEAALATRPAPPPNTPPVVPLLRRRIPTPTPAEGQIPEPPPPPNPLARLQAVARDVAGAFDFMSSLFGPPPVKTLTVSPIPGTFGQGFGGLVYLSTLAYLDPAERPASAHNAYGQKFFSDLLDVHEVAHQWWGNLVAPEGYQDNWLIESLANYSALLYLEKKEGTQALEAVLAEYKRHLLAKAPNGKTMESAGPITWGYRLISSDSPWAWETITYEKGSWVIHMLRRMLGDEKFTALLHETARRYANSMLSTQDFEALTRTFAPHAAAADVDSFFENWVYGVGIPSVKLRYSVRGLKVTGTLAQSNVPDDFAARVPIEVISPKQRTLHWVTTGGDPVPFSIALPAPGAKLALAANDGLITVEP